MILGFLVFLLVLASYLIPGLFVSRHMYREHPALFEDFDIFDPNYVVPILLAIVFWPLYPIPGLVRRFYQGDRPTVTVPGRPK